MTERVGLGTIVREWGRIGCIGFGGPPAHITLLRRLCVQDRKWIDADEFEDGIAATNLLPGPASTQLAILCAWRVRGLPGALVGGVCFIVPGLLLILALAVLFLSGAAPLWVRGAAAGAGSAVAAVAVRAALDLVPSSRKRARDRGHRARWYAYLVIGGVAAVAIGPYLVLVLVACGLVEIAVRRIPLTRGHTALPVALGGLSLGSGLAALSWVAFKVGALSYGGGFVIIPLMQSEAVGHHWMTAGEFTTAVALGQITPGPVVQTVAVVGYAAAGLGGGLLAALVAFAPSFVLVLAAAPRFDRLRSSPAVQGFFDGAGPAVIGAIAGSAVTLARTLEHPWQFAVLGAALLALLALRRGVVSTLLGAGVLGVAVALAGLAV